MEKKFRLSNVVRHIFRTLFVIWIVLVLKWSKLGSKADIGYNSSDSKFKKIDGNIFKETLQSGFEIKKVRPDKIFTPNGDGWNDYFEIQYSNPKDAVLSGKIYDSKSAFIAYMQKDAIQETLKWDGKDSNGNLAKGGVYIYQIEISGSENKVVHGTVVLAR